MNRLMTAWAESDTLRVQGGLSSPLLGDVETTPLVKLYLALLPGIAT
jgi:hypothetical protein